MSTQKTTYKDALPFQQQNIASNQQVAIPYLGGTRVLAVIWMMAPQDEQIKDAANAKKN